MPLLLRENAAFLADISLKNNDIVFEVITPDSQREVKVYASRREQEAAAREFSKRTEFRWDAFIYFIDPAHKDDPAYHSSAKSYHHIHMYATLILGKGLLIDRLLPKSGHDKGEYRVNLANEPLSEWDRLVANMSSPTRIAVERFRVHVVERYLMQQAP